MSENEEYEEEEDGCEEVGEGEQEEESKSVVKEITDYEEGKTTYLYDDGTYETVYHQAEEHSDCFVATACYGSALDKHVVFLREFRDLEVMRTRVGRSFMRFFDVLYYSFSPSLASFIARHRISKLIARDTIVAPTIHLLRVSRYLAKPLNKVSPELSVGATGVIFAVFLGVVVWALLLLIR